LSFFVNKINFRIEKVFPFRVVCFPPFGEIVIVLFVWTKLLPLIGKTQLISQFCPLLSVRFLLILSKFLWIFSSIRLSSFICQISLAALCDLRYWSVEALLIHFTIVRRFSA